MLTIDERKIAGPTTGAPSADGTSSFRRILVPVSAPEESRPALAVAARICALANGVLRLVHVRTCDPPLPIAGTFYLETPGEATAMLEEALPMAWACGGPRATTTVVDARRSDVDVAIAWQAAAWPADLIVLTRHPKLAITRLIRGSVPDQLMRKAACPVLAVPPGQSTRVRRLVHRRGHPRHPPSRSPSPLTREARQGPATRRPPQQRPRPRWPFPCPHGRRPRDHATGRPVPGPRGGPDRWPGAGRRRSRS